MESVQATLNLLHDLLPGSSITGAGLVRVSAANAAGTITGPDVNLDLYGNDNANATSSGNLYIRASGNISGDSTTTGSWADVFGFAGISGSVSAKNDATVTTYGTLSGDVTPKAGSAVVKAEQISGDTPRLPCWAKWRRPSPH